MSSAPTPTSTPGDSDSSTAGIPGTATELMVIGKPGVILDLGSLERLLIQRIMENGIPPEGYIQDIAREITQYVREWLQESVGSSTLDISNALTGPENPPDTLT